MTSAPVPLAEQPQREAGFYMIKMTAGSPPEPAQWSQALHCWLTCGSKEQIPDRLVDRVIGPIATLQQHEHDQVRIRQLDDENQRFMREVAGLRQQHEHALATLRRTLTFLTDPRWGMWRYMEGSEVYSDINDAADDIRNVLGDTK